MALNTAALVPVSLALALAALPASAQWTITEVSKLTSSTPGDLARYGKSVAVHGDLAVVGAPDESNAGGDDAGAAYVYERDPSTGVWSEVAVLLASDAMPFDEFGFAVDIEGDTIAVGAPLSDHSGEANSGSVYLFERNRGGPNAWGEIRKLVAADPEQTAQLGQSVALAGSFVFAGAPLRSDPGTLASHVGAAYVWERDAGGPGAFGQVAVLVSATAGADSEFGHSVAASGETVVVGAWQEQGGRAYVFDRDQGGPGAWGFVAQLAGVGVLPEQFGVSVDVEGDRALVGANYYNVRRGTAYVFERAQGPGQWGLVKQLDTDTPGQQEEAGISVSLSGDTALVGAHLDDFSTLLNPGSALAFARDEGGPANWGQVAMFTAFDAEERDQFGRSVAIDVVTVFVGAHRDNHSGFVKAGSAYVFGLCSPPETYCTAGLSASGCQPVIAATGNASATATSGFTLSVTELEGDKDGLFFYGTNGRQANPWGSSTSYVCVIPPRLRGGLLSGGGAPGTCEGAISQDLNARWCPTCPKPAHNPGLGAVVQAQLWYRDPQNTSNQTSSMSGAIEFCVGP